MDICRIPLICRVTPLDGIRPFFVWLKTPEAICRVWWRQVRLYDGSAEVKYSTCINFDNKVIHHRECSNGFMLPPQWTTKLEASVHRTIARCTHMIVLFSFSFFHFIHVGLLVWFHIFFLYHFIPLSVQLQTWLFGFSTFFFSSLYFVHEIKICFEWNEMKERKHKKRNEKEKK